MKTGTRVFYWVKDVNGREHVYPNGDISGVIKKHGTVTGNRTKPRREVQIRISGTDLTTYIRESYVYPE